MGAIDTLREGLGDIDPLGARASALAEVEALLQAAERVTEHDPDETEGREHLYALAAAVRRVKGDT